MLVCFISNLFICSFWFYTFLGEEKGEEENDIDNIEREENDEMIVTKSIN